LTVDCGKHSICVPLAEFASHQGGLPALWACHKQHECKSPLHNGAHRR